MRDCTLSFNSVYLTLLLGLPPLFSFYNSLLISFFNLTIFLSSRFVFLHSPTCSSPPILRHSFSSSSLAFSLFPPSSFLTHFTSLLFLFLLPCEPITLALVFLLPLPSPLFPLTHVFLFFSVSFSFAFPLLYSLFLFSIT